MPTRPFLTVLPRARYLSLAVVLAVAPHWAATAAAQPAIPDKMFSGIYLGAEAGQVNVIGGALVSGVDTLAQDSRPAITAFVGGRYQFANRLVIGAEFGFGKEDGDLRLDDPTRGLTVDYINDTHSRLGGTIGVALGAARRTHLFAYLAELSRDFDVTITENGRVTEQRDEQGLLRYGIGLEQHLTGRLALRGTLGSSRADFGDRVTNITVDRPLEAAVGLLIRF